MNTKKLLNLALEGVDNLGFRLDSLGITSKLNRHNIAAFVMAEQKHLEGEWDSIQAKVDRRRSQFERIAGQVEARADVMFSPIVSRVNRLRTGQ
ncbi:hypothetical protein [Marinobacter sp.]|uniref:hypothetical protein n=1 Tax=Marinobacter sp. TaxID=50741 RepID=UPI0019FB7CA2|nr:hypothetical protein [Marinobacter sp.]MBE0487109.1 hypothetical protein [Marinobacter sp.]